MQYLNPTSNQPTKEATKRIACPTVSYRFAFRFVSFVCAFLPAAGYYGEQSLRLDPYLLEMDDVLEKWLEHFDGTRGTHVCLVDSLDPTTNTTASSRAGRGGSSVGVSGGGGGGNGDDSRSRSGSAGIPPQPQPLQRRNNNRNNNNKTQSSSSSTAKPTTGLGSIIEDPLWRRLLFGEGESTPVEAAAGRGAAGADADDAGWTELSGNKNDNHSSHGGKNGVQAGGAGGDGGSEEESTEGFGAARVSESGVG